MTFLVYLLLVIGIMLLVNGLMQPKTFRVYRTISINSPGKDVYPLIADLKHWDNWSPWAQKDPNMRKDYSSPSTESGAYYRWSGNKDVGKGQMTIVDTIPDKNVALKLDIEAPFEAHNDVVLSLESENGTSTVTWAMTGSQNFFMRVMSFAFNMDKMVGSDFESGLENLKQLAERAESE